MAAKCTVFSEVKSAVEKTKAACDKFLALQCVPGFPTVTVRKKYMRILQGADLLTQAPFINLPRLRSRLANKPMLLTTFNRHQADQKERTNEFIDDKKFVVADLEYELHTRIKYFNSD